MGVHDPVHSPHVKERQMTNPDVATDRATSRVWLGLGVLVLSSFMMATDITMLFLVMPALSADLAPSTTQMLWILHIGEFAAAGLVITMGRLTDKIGRRRDRKSGV